ncbi:ETC complex I subunit [Hirschia baltica]|uniref:ETC complex I subunit conserved region n=1 Tax=Hirschia baltica (strain ATCC 49814 / DSM 5838 / IFAM 1418) TaxID=582402 RepID=C6XK99_HIRBI|nr:ETC complex I subunit [Hirschia baltica]ACT59544.1 ETC complex I subunit conserved region [Hirschia baltica ATCC 49814]
MLAKIYKPSKNAMQSGKAKSDTWVLEMDVAASRSIDPLMGWTSTDSTETQLRMKFDSSEEAISYAKREGLEFTVVTPRAPKRIIKTYAENFSADRKNPWTH